ncbi:MAG: indole-3-glycerol phosphate synthase TrpC [Acidobacteria bacterium]|nr:indole-3-glycerol phosphate synthase TrpC [Acidobacteriota bacterium]
MTGTILDKIIQRKRERILELEPPIDILMADAKEVRARANPHALRAALSRKGQTNIIAEIKRVSPSKGVINDQIDVAELARNYAASRAAAISVLTEEDFFKGSLDDLRIVKQAVDLPVLRKDFTIDEYQIYEAAAAGADAILLIVAALNEEELKRFRSLAEDELGMDAVVEVHSAAELEAAKRIGATIIGVNNRDLKTFEVSLDVSRQLIARRPPDALMISESGLTSRAEIDELRELGYDGFLIGETFMRQPQLVGVLAGGEP